MEAKIFTRDDIMAGYLLVIENTETGEKFNATVVPGGYDDPKYDEGKLGCCCPGKFWCRLAEFDKYMTVSTYKIVAVYGFTYNDSLLNNETENRDLLWKRSKEPKKMTVAEIREVLGCDVEIVG